MIWPGISWIHVDNGPILSLQGLYVLFSLRHLVVQELAAVVHFLVQNLQSTPYFGAHSKVPPPPPPPEMKIVTDFISEVVQVGSAKYPSPWKFKNNRFGLSVQSWVSKVPPPSPKIQK